MIIGLPVKFGRKMMKTMNNNKKPKNIIPVTLSIVDNRSSINGDESITLSLVSKNIPTKNPFKKQLNEVHLNEVHLPVYHHVYGNDSLDEYDLT